MAAQTCSVCGASLVSQDPNCPQCGNRAHVIITPDPVAIRSLILPPSTVSDWYDPATGDGEITVNDPYVRSQTHSDAGVVSLDVEGSASIGRSSERRVTEILHEAMSADRRGVVVTQGSDDRGEDGLLHIGSRTLTLQITAVPAEPHFWRAAHVSSATTEVQQPHAENWLHTAIVNKAARLSLEQRSSTVLAIDARHAGVLGTATLVDGDLATYGCPSREFGFASVWVVGPTVRYCRRLGSGSP